MNKRFSTVGICFGIALALAAGGLTAARAESPQEIVLKREKAMKELGGHMGAIKTFLQDGTGSAEDVARRAGEIGAIAAKMPAMFPEGTEMNGAADSKYKARPEIWLDTEGFEKAARRLESESKALATAAGGGDKAAVAAAFQSLGKNGCSECHKSYRLKLN